MKKPKIHATCSPGPIKLNNLGWQAAFCGGYAYAFSDNLSEIACRRCRAALERTKKDPPKIARDPQGNYVIKPWDNSGARELIELLESQAGLP